MMTDRQADIVKLTGTFFQILVDEETTQKKGKRRAD
jgi:hypothetical protein